jgi:hypothetical protein
VTFKEVKTLTGCVFSGMWAVLTINPHRLDDAFIKADKIRADAKARKTTP